MKTSLEHDLKLLNDNSLDYKKRFAIVYRSERKLILQSQIEIVNWTKSVIKGLQQVKEQVRTD